ncbi:MAG: hypothetical protein FWG08_05340, partial [Propionibacteriaceae bacterium]|nr:hypothetical protein [Propionibacteriaceae bacterium]
MGVFHLSHGKAYVFYPEISEEKTTAALLLDITPLDLTRGKGDWKGGVMFDYVYDRPYVSSVCSPLKANQSIHDCSCPRVEVSSRIGGDECRRIMGY